jgi:hypothetical protein
MLKLDIDHALGFLDMLDPGGRHTIASEAPFGRYDGGPRWEGGATFEAGQRRLLIEDITRRQARGSNVYYGVNRPCSAAKQHGNNGKCNGEDIVSIRALVFDIDFTEKRTPHIDEALLAFIDRTLINELHPSLIVDSGGGVQLIYLLERFVDVTRFRPPKTDKEQDINGQIEINCRAITELATDCETLLRQQVPPSLPIKIDSMSNIDRVMRLPGTINHPKAEKIARGQVEALAHIAKDNQIKCDIYALRKVVPRVEASPTAQRAQPKRLPPHNPHWPPYRKAQACCEFMRGNGLADSNDWYAPNVLLPLLGAVQDHELTTEQAEECFMLAVSGGARYGTIGRGDAYFQRQWRSHRNAVRTNHRTLATLFWVCKENGMKLPWIGTVAWEEEFQRNLRELIESRQIVSEDVKEIFDVKD